MIVLGTNVSFCAPMRWFESPDALKVEIVETVVFFVCELGKRVAPAHRKKAIEVWKLTSKNAKRFSEVNSDPGPPTDTWI